MRIAMVSEHASPLAVVGGVDAGGQNVHVAALADALAALGHEVRVWTRADAPDLPRQVRLRSGVVVEHVPAGPAHELPKDDLPEHMPAFAGYLAGRWRTWRPDVVHAHFWMSGLASTEAAGPLGVPVVLTLHALGVVKRRHQGEQDTSPPAREEIEARLARGCAAVIATSREEVTELARLGMPRGRAVVVPCGVDTHLFSPVGRRHPAVPDDGRPRLLSIGRLVRRKGIDETVAALADLPGAELVVAGGAGRARQAHDPEAARLLRLADRVGVAGRVRMLGGVPREEIPALYRSVEVVVCAPWYEPFGMTAVEAMACGVPVVAAAVGGLRDSVVAGVTGLHVPPRRPDLLAAALRTLLADRVRRADYGVAGARRAAAHYAWPRVAVATLAVYERVLTSRAPAAVQDSRAEVDA